MKKRAMMFLFLVIVLISNSYSQQIELRLDIGNSINFTSYRSKLFQDYYQGPISTSEYTYTKLARSSLFSLPTNLGLSLEFDYKVKNHFTLGFMFGEILSIKDRVIYNYALPGADSSGYNTVNPWSSSSDTETPLLKVGFAYARDFGDGRLRLSPFIGLNYAWVGNKPTPFDTLLTSNIKLSHDVMFPSSEFYINGYETFTEYTSTFMGSIGFSLKFHSKKRELFAIKVYYEQGFRAVIMKQVVVYRNSNKFVNNLSYSYGSALYLKLSIPIPVYNFDKSRNKEE